MKTRYDNFAIFLHWLIATLVVGMLVLGFVMGDANKAIQGDLYMWHKGIGLLILLLMVIRLIWRLTHPAPAYPSSMPAWQKTAAKINHFLLYLLLLLMPLTGWLLASAAGYYPKIFGVSIPFPIAQSKVWANYFGSAHEFLAWAIIVVVGIHLLAALKHLFSGDGIFHRMTGCSCGSKKK